VTDPVSAYFAAVNAEDWAALADLWEPDAELVATGARPRHGREDIMAFYPRVLAGYGEHEDRPVRRIKEGSTVVVEVASTGRTTAGRSPSTRSTCSTWPARGSGGCPPGMTRRR